MFICECTPRDALPHTSARLVIEEESRCRELLRCVVTSLRTTFIGRLKESIDCCAKESEGVTSSFSSWIVETFNIKISVPGTLHDHCCSTFYISLNFLLFMYKRIVNIYFKQFNKAIINTVYIYSIFLSP